MAVIGIPSSSVFNVGARAAIPPPRDSLWRKGPRRSIVSLSSARMPGEAILGRITRFRGNHETTSDHRRARGRGAGHLRSDAAPLPPWRPTDDAVGRAVCRHRRLGGLRQRHHALRTTRSACGRARRTRCVLGGMLGGSVVSAACTGATTRRRLVAAAGSDLAEQGETRPGDAARHDHRGVNDLGWQDVLGACSDPGTRCGSARTRWLAWNRGRCRGVPAASPRADRRVRAAAPDAKIIVTGYPKLFGDVSEELQRRRGRPGHADELLAQRSRRDLLNDTGVGA